MRSTELTRPFAIVTRDELWLLGSEPLLRDQRLSHGRAVARGDEVDAVDDPDPELLAIVARELEQTRRSLPAAAGVTARVVVSARRTAGHRIVDAAVALSVGSLGVVSSPAHAAADTERLLRIAAVAPVAERDDPGIPILWRDGSAAVLLHEAVGHPAEHRHSPLQWPEWLSVRDEPPFPVDDTGSAVEDADLLLGQVPAAKRRATFSDVPLRRLSNVVVRQSNAPFECPAQRIEVFLVAGGRYDPLTERLKIFIAAADLVDERGSRRLRPFLLDEPRQTVARSLVGASGGPQRYPGVICSAEGQEIVVGSSAPDLITEFR